MNWPPRNRAAIFRPKGGWDLERYHHLPTSRWTKSPLEMNYPLGCDGPKCKAREDNSATITAPAFLHLQNPAKLTHYKRRHQNWFWQGQMYHFSSTTRAEGRRFLPDLNTSRCFLFSALVQKERFSLPRNPFATSFWEPHGAAQPWLPPAVHQFPASKPYVDDVSRTSDSGPVQFSYIRKAFPMYCKKNHHQQQKTPL